MTKEEREDAIRSVRMAFAIWEDEYDTGEDWSGEHKARDRAIKALKQESILDKAKLEITGLVDSDAYGAYLHGFNYGLMRAVQIIDKCKADSEVNDEHNNSQN